MEKMKVLRKRILIEGVVQGVGFRPHVYRAARACGVSGHTRNTDSGVEIEAQGPAGALDKFIAAVKKAPPRAQITSVSITAVKPKKENSFVILKSARGQNSALIPPDIAMCPACAGEIADKKDRRYLYPLANCTDCGPRFSITRALPYDRKNTTMRKFKMCPSCGAEYADPLSRRFHAEPNACPACGPRVFWARQNKTLWDTPALEAAASAIKKGRIIGVKSIGGFHLACDAHAPRAVVKLRRLKNRPHKPFAVMCADIKTAKKYCFINKKEEEALLSPPAPVVLLKKKKDMAGVAPGMNTLGVMLPFTPLHKILFNLCGRDALVMTSANEMREPVIAGNKEAAAFLPGITDGLLMHEREIYNKQDDSVVFELNGKIYFIRRARGYTPAAIKLPVKAKKNILALGAEKTAAFCLVKGDNAFLSQYLGDTAGAGAQKFYLDTLKKTQKLFNIKPSVIMRDLHGGYFTAQKFPKATPVQHHAAHALAVAAEHDIKPPFLGIIMDGTGLGTDNTVWGAEFLLFNGKSWARAGHLKEIPLIGGDGAVTEIWKLALAYAAAAGVPFNIKGIKQADINTARKMAAAGINCPAASSMGRLFDAAAVMAGIRNSVTYQGQAAMELEALCAAPRKPYSFNIERHGGRFVINPLPMIKEIAEGREKKEVISARFHATVIEMCADMAAAVLGKKQMPVVLSGGCFQNKILLAGVMKALGGYKVFTGEAAPCNDGGVALGQAYAALFKAREKKLL